MHYDVGITCYDRERDEGLNYSYDGFASLALVWSDSDILKMESV